jgi:transcriptional regulator with XRE-family HTH domain
MPARTRRGDAAAQDAQLQTARLLRELREARLESGLSLEAAARVAGVSPAQLGRLERGEILEPTVVQLARAWAPYGFRISAREFRVGSPVRDRAQLALLERFETCLGEPLRLRREVPIPTQGDPRTWDGMIEGAGEPFFVEGESRIRDVQAVERKLRLRLRDDPRASLVLLVATRSAHNRRVLALHREALRDLLPLDGAAILRALRSGMRPSASGIVLL